MFVAIPHETVYLAKIVFIRSYCDFFINCRTTPIVRSFVRFANPQKRFCAGEQPNRCQSSPRCHASVSGRLRKLPGRKVTPEQIPEREAVDAVAVARYSEVVRVGVHIAHHSPTLNKPGMGWSFSSHTSMSLLVRRPPITVMNIA